MSGLTDAHDAGLMDAHDAGLVRLEVGEPDFDTPEHVVDGGLFDVLLESNRGSDDGQTPRFGFTCHGSHVLVTDDCLRPYGDATPGSATSDDTRDAISDDTRDAISDDTRD